MEGALDLYRQLLDQLAGGEEHGRLALTVAWLEYQLDQRNAALTTLTEALVRTPQLEFRPELYDDAFHRLFLQARPRALATRRSQATDLTLQGLARLRAGDAPAARRFLADALVLLPTHAEALYNLALLDLRVGKDPEARTAFERLLATARDEEERNAESTVSTTLRARSLASLGLIDARAGRPAEAAEALEGSVALDPQSASAWNNLGTVRRTLDDPAAAAEAFRRAAALAPDDTSVAYNLSLALMDAGDSTAAVTHLLDATSRHPQDARLWLARGRAELASGDPAAASSFEQAIVHDPADTAGWARAAALDMARHALGTGDVEDVLAQADRVLAWRRGDVEAWIFRGQALLELGELEMARQSFATARGLDPARADIPGHLGSALYAMGRHSEARDAFVDALELDPSSPGIQANLKIVEGVLAGEDAGQLAGNAQRPSTGSKPPPPPPPPPPVAPIGLVFADVDYATLDLSGALVESVEADSLAQRAGVTANDLILKADGREIASPADLERYLETRPRGATVRLDLLRNNRPQSAELRFE